MREARDVFPEVGYEERKLGVLQVLLLFNVIFLYNFFGYRGISNSLSTTYC